MDTAVQLIVAVLVPIADEAKPVASPQVIAPPMVKFVLDISKKILPTASTFILAFVDGVVGITKASAPSFGVLAVNMVAKISPPSVLKLIFTLAQLTGAAVVLFTLHVIDCVEPPAHVTPVFGAVTANGPDVLLTVTTAFVNCVCPILYGAVEM